MRETKWFFLLAAMVFVIGFVRSTLGAAPEQKLIVAVGQEPTSIDPSLSSVGGDYAVVDNWGEYIFYRAPDGQLKPGLLTSWKVSSDGKTIDCTLRKGVKFHSGDPLTSRDVAFSFERGNAKNPTVKSRLKLFDRVEVIDDYHFKFHFKTPDVTFIPNRGGAAIVSKTYYDRVGEDQFVKEPVGTGPYKVVRYVPGEYVDMERFDDYWGEKPPVREARFLFVPEEMTRVAKLKAGEVDLIQNVPYPLVAEIEKTRGLKTIRFATNHPTVSVVFSTRNPTTPWHDKRVRLAMAYAIDWKSMNKNVFYGIPNHYAFLAPYELGFDPSFKPYPYDPQKARALLAEAGFPQGFDLKFYWPVTGRFPMSREGAEAIASYLEAVNIRTKLIGEEWASFYSRYRPSKAENAEYVCYFSGGRSAAPDPTYYLDLFFSSDGGFSVYSNPELDKVIDEAKATMNDAKRAELIRKGVRIVEEEVPSIPIFNTVAVYGMKENIDFKPTQRLNMDLVLVKDVVKK